MARRALGWPEAATSQEVALLSAPEAQLYDDFLSADEARQLFDRLRSDIAWRQDAMRIAGRSINLPRLTAWYGDPGTTHTYSGIRNVPLEWTPDLQELKSRSEAIAGASFNSVLLNLYRSGTDSMGWHSDDEYDTGSIIASVSLGAVRTFQFRRKAPPADIVSMRLTSGSLLVMWGNCQRLWTHRVPKETASGARINLTFRAVLPKLDARP